MVFALFNQALGYTVVDVIEPEKVNRIFLKQDGGENYIGALETSGGSVENTVIIL